MLLEIRRSSRLKKIVDVCLDMNYMDQIRLAAGRPAGRPADGTGIASCDYWGFPIPRHVGKRELESKALKK